MPRKRQNRLEPIREIVRGGRVRTHEDVAVALQLRGFASGQGTVSRDMAEVGVSKASDGTYVLDSDMDIHLLAPFVTGVTHDGQMVVIGTRCCAARAVAAAVENAGFPGVLCTVSGPESVLLACHTPVDATRVSGVIGRLVS